MITTYPIDRWLDSAAYREQQKQWREAAKSQPTELRRRVIPHSFRVQATGEEFGPFGSRVAASVAAWTKGHADREIDLVPHY